MQETRRDGQVITTLLSELVDEREKQVNAAIANPENAEVKVFNVGQKITHSDGRVYEIQANGSWKRIDPVAV